MRRAWPDLPGVAVWPWADDDLSICIEPSGEARADTAVIDAEWNRQAAANPRLFDGPILSVTRLVPGHELRVQRDSYKRLAVRPVVETAVDQLSVTGVVLGRDEQGEDRVLLGRRGTQTRIYGGMWELGPSGGVDPPPANRTALRKEDLANQLQREFEEETGCRSSLQDVRHQAICQDMHAGSTDVVFTCRTGETAGLAWSDAERWEYDGFLWLRMADIPAFDGDHGHKIIPPTRALFRFLGWV